MTDSNLQALNGISQNIIMRYLTINQHQIALAFRDGRYLKYLAPGSYWLRTGTTVQYFDEAEMVPEKLPLNVLLEDPLIKNKIEVIDIDDHEMGFLYRHNRFIRILQPGRYALWNSAIQWEVRRLDYRELEAPQWIRNLSYPGQLQRYHVLEVQIQPYEKAIILVDGESIGMKGAGRYFYQTKLYNVEVRRVDMRQRQMEIAGQEILTKDKAGIRVSAFAEYLVNDPERVMMEVDNHESQLRVALQLAMRTHAGRRTLDELLAEKESMSAEVLAEVETTAKVLGLELSNYGIRDIILPGDVKDIMNQVLVAQKRAQANIITRREETASTRSLLNTARLMEDNEMLYRLKEMEYVEKIADKIQGITIAGGSQILGQLKELFATSE